MNHGRWMVTHQNPQGRCVSSAELIRLKRGGDWLMRSGFPPQPSCKEPIRKKGEQTDDANQPCTANRDCAGRYCLADAQSASTLKGKCTTKFIHSGCVTYIDDGALGTACTAH